MKKIVVFLIALVYFSLCLLMLIICLCALYLGQWMACFGVLLSVLMAIDMVNTLSDA